MWFCLLWVLGLISAFVHVSVAGFPQSVSKVCEIVLLHQFVVTFGLIGIIGVLVDIVFPDFSSKRTGWQGGPYQTKYGFTQVLVGTMGVMAIWFRGNFWIAVLITIYVYIMSGIWTHVQEMIKSGKSDVNNTSNLIIAIVYATFITIVSVLTRVVWHS